MEEIRWEDPWTCIIAGPSGAGKSVFVSNFLSNLDVMSRTKFARVIVHYAEWQSAYEKLVAPGCLIEFREGLPQEDEYTDGQPKLVILGDLMNETGGTVVDLFTKGSHHKNLSVFYLTQNLFHQGRGQRDISLNANYLVVFKNPQDRAQIRHLARQVYPENPLFLQEAYLDATSRPHGYLVLDLKQTTSEDLRVRTNIFPADEYSALPPIFYVPKSSKRRFVGKQKI